MSQFNPMSFLMDAQAMLCQKQINGLSELADELQLHGDPPERWFSDTGVPYVDELVAYCRRVTRVLCDVMLEDDVDYKLNAQQQQLAALGICTLSD